MTTQHLIGINSITSLRYAVQAAARDRLDGTVLLTHPVPWERPENWPLPAKRQRPAEGASVVTQAYRQEAVLEYCDWCERPARPGLAAKPTPAETSQSKPDQGAA